MFKRVFGITVPVMGARLSLRSFLFVFKALHGLAPGYISELVIPYSTCPLRLTDQIIAFHSTQSLKPEVTAFPVVGP